MKVSARVQSSRGQHHVSLATNDQVHSIHIAPKTTGFGSSANRGELLFLALATCYCNDIYREAAKRGVSVERVEVEVAGEFGAEGDSARNVTYGAKVWAQAPAQAIRDLMSHTDRVAEIQNTLRAGTAVTLGRIEAVSGTSRPRPEEAAGIRVSRRAARRSTRAARGRSRGWRGPGRSGPPR